LPVVNLDTGEIVNAQIFVACLGASNYTFAEATPSQELPHWIGSHQRALAFLGGVPRCCQTTIRLARRINHSVLDLVMRSRLFSPLNTNLDGCLDKGYKSFVIDARKI
jgi:hypothetical protein